MWSVKCKNITVCLVFQRSLIKSLPLSGVTNASTKRCLYSLPAGAFIQKNRSSKMPLRKAWTHRNLYTENFLRKETFTSRNLRSHNPSHRAVSTYRRLYTAAFTHRHLYPQMLWHTWTETTFRILMNCIGRENDTKPKNLTHREFSGRGELAADAQYSCGGSTCPP